MPTPLFILGTHRGGTTLLQRVCNSCDDVVIWGEHAGFLRQIAEAFFAGMENPHLFQDVRVDATSDPATDWQAWMNGFSREDWVRDYRTFIERLLVPSQRAVAVWGFKEIRYGVSPPDRTIELLAALFPAAHFAFIVRNPYNMIASARRRPGGPSNLADLRRVCDNWVARLHTFRRWHQSGKLRSVWVAYEELIEGCGEVVTLLERLGHTFGPAQRSVITAESGRGSSFKGGDVHSRWQDLPRTWRALTRDRLGTLAGELGYPPPPLAVGWRQLAPLLGRLGAAERAK